MNLLGSIYFYNWFLYFLIAGTRSSITLTRDLVLLIRDGRQLFMTTCWFMLTWRNKAIFEEDFQQPNNLS